MASAFRPLEAGADRIEFEFEGEHLTAPAGATVAAALLLAGHGAFRLTPVSDTARGPFCLMGSCFDCLVEIDGESNQQACMTQLRDGMRIERMRLNGPDESPAQ